MKKSLLIIIVPALLLTLNSCGKRKGTNTLETPSEISSNVVYDADVQAELNLLAKTQNFTETRTNIVISKNNKRYYSNYKIDTYDKKNGYAYESQSIQGYNNFDSASQQYSQNTYVYYDGVYSYTLDNDNVYAKKNEKKTIQYFQLGLNFSVSESLEYKLEGYTHKLTGVVKQTNVNTFYGKELSGVNEIKFEVKTDGEKIESISLSFEKDGYTVKEDSKYEYTDKNITLPTLVKVVK